MNDIEYFNTFAFRELRHRRYYHTDSSGGVIAHYLGYLYEGSASLVSEGRRIELASGDLFYIPKGCKYHSYWRGDDAIRLASLRFEFFPCAHSRGYALQKLKTDARTERLLERLLADLTVTTESIGLLYLLLGLLQPSMTESGGTARRTVVEAAMRYMSRCGTARMSEVAAACQVSETTLYQAFRRELDRTPNSVRISLLCRQAEQLLQMTDLSVEEISGKLGFSSSSYFRKVLFGETGKTPRQLRKEARAI